MSVLFSALGAVCMFAMLGAAVAALIAGGDRSTWSEYGRIFGHPEIQCVQVEVVGALTDVAGSPGLVTSPAGERPCAWFVVWASTDPGAAIADRERQFAARRLVLLARSSAPLVVRAVPDASGANRELTINSAAAWVEPGSGEPNLEAEHPAMPIGGGPVHRSAHLLPDIHHTWRTFAADRRSGPASGTTAVSEVVLDPGARRSVYGLVRPSADGSMRATIVPPPGSAGVLVLQPGSEVPALTARQIGDARLRARRWWRRSALAAAGFVLSLAGAVAAS